MVHDIVAQGMLMLYVFFFPDFTVPVYSTEQSGAR